MPAETREAWLEQAIGLLLPACFPAGTQPPPIKVSVGWPKGTRGRKPAIGQCWGQACSSDTKTAHIFVAPNVEAPVEALRVLTHELVHACVGVEAQHKGAFVKLAKVVGFLPPWTSTPASDALLARLGEVAQALGEYPHVGLMAPARKAQKGRMRLWMCPCGVKVRKAGELHARCLDCDGDFERG